MPSPEQDEGLAPPFQDPVEEILAGILELPESQWGAALERACHEHPEESTQILRRVAVLERTHLIDSAQVSAEGPAEERFGAYRLVRELGGGGMGVVYLAHREGQEAPVALKLIRPDHLLFSGARQRFAREIDTVSKLQHPGIVRVLEVGEVRGIPFLAMERIDGTTLGEVLRHLEGENPARLTGKDLWLTLRAQAAGSADAGVPEAFRGSWTRACLSLIVQVARALEHAHERGVLHRDVKPSNVMVTGRGEARLLDFGLARSEGVTPLTQTGATLGSLPYMAPEQLDGRSGIDGRADVYSLGVTLFELLTFEAPYSSNNAERLRRKILHGDAPLLRELNAEVPVEVETVCRKAMERDPERRYASAAALAADLERALEGRPIQARRPGPARRVLRWFERHPLAGVVAVLILLQIVVTQVVLLWDAAGKRDRDTEVMNAAMTVRRETEALKERTESALQETRALLTAALPYSLPVEASQLRVLEDPRAAEEWLRKTDLLLENKEEVLEEARQREAAAEADALPESLRKTAQLKQRFDTLEWLRDQVLQDLELASQLSARTVDSPEAQAAWREARDDVFLREVYDGLELVPQLGLLPLRPDPQSGLWEFLHVQSGEAPVLRDAYDAYSSWKIEEATGIVLVLIPGETVRHDRVPKGDLPMGATAELEPQYVDLAPFFLSKYEVTKAQWKRLYRGATPLSEWSGSQGLDPVESVSWLECRDWLARARLEFPTVLQWEHAYRGGKRFQYLKGDDPESLRGHANFADPLASLPFSLDLSGENVWRDGYSFTAPVGGFLPGAFGLHDVAGNVAEFTADGEGEWTPARAGDGGTLEASVERGVLVKGGSWRDPLTEMTWSAESARKVYPRYDDVGLRPARKLDR